MPDNVNVLDVLGRAAGYILCEAGSESDDYLAMHDAIVRIAELIAAVDEYKTLNHTLNRLDASSIAEGLEIFDRKRLVSDMQKAWGRASAALSACTGGSNG